MTDTDQPNATHLERAIHDHLASEYQKVTLGRLDETYAIVPVSALNALRWAIDPTRPPPRPFVSFDPAMKGGQPTVNGTRLTVENLVVHVWGGWAEQQLQEGWGLSRHDILTACWFQAENGSRTWKRRWLPWANRVFPLLHRARGAEDVALIDWPPCSTD